MNSPELPNSTSECKKYSKAINYIKKDWSQFKSITSFLLYHHIEIM